MSNLVVGDYTFILKVTDARGQSDTTKVTVVVQPEKNEPPVAKAGSDKVRTIAAIALRIGLSRQKTCKSKQDNIIN